MNTAVCSGNPLLSGVICTHVNVFVALYNSDESEYSIAMYIDIVPNRKSPPAILLRENHRRDGKSVKTTIANLSKCPPEAIEALFTGDDVRRFHEVVRRVPIAEELVRYAVRLAGASRPGQAETPSFINDWVSWGAGLRAPQYVVLGAKARALFEGRSHVTLEDIQALVHATFRHRILIGYRAEAEGVSVETVIDRLLETVSPPLNLS